MNLESSIWISEPSDNPSDSERIKKKVEKKTESWQILQILMDGES